uniref:G-protein coupled receptors family 1 profile domain-containing protein n=1 Tax=Clytia hemisphaerica TaxID=252671 RepID=A0A7M5U646_9CNID
MGRGKRGPPQNGQTSLQNYQAQIQLTVAVIVIIFNLMEIFVLKFLQRSRRTFEYLLLSLSISDLLFGITVVVMSTAQIFGCRSVLKQAHFLYLIFAVFISFTYIVGDARSFTSHLAANALQIIVSGTARKLSGHFKRVFFIIGLSWIIPIAVMFGILVDAHVNKNGKVKKQINLGILVCVLFANAFFIPSYIILISKLCNLQNKVAPIDQETTTSSPTSLSTKSTSRVGTNNRTKVNTARQRHILLLTCLTAFAFSGCTLPIAIAQFQSGNGEIPFYAKLLLVLNSALNSVFYFGYWRLRKFVKRRKAKRRT